MKRILFAMAVLTVSTSAFAQNFIDPYGPVRHGAKCFALSDSRGFGYWDKCASKQEIQELSKYKGTTTLIDIAETQKDVRGGDGGGAGGGGGGGGGGGNR